MRRRTTSSNHLVAKLSRQWQVSKPVAMHVSHLLAAKAILGAPKPVWDSFHSRPRHDCFPDQLTGSLHPRLEL